MQKNNTYDWADYYKLYETKPHTKTLEKAITEYCKDIGTALDIGAGNLRDTNIC